MSTTGSNVEGSTSPLFPTPEPFKHAVTHVFFPVNLPKDSDCTIENDLALASAVCAVAHAYTLHLQGTPEEDHWGRITKMLGNLRDSVQSKGLDKDLTLTQLSTMEIGDITTFFLRPKNAAIMLTKQEDSTLLESFNVSPTEHDVEWASGSIVCWYPKSAVEMPTRSFDDEAFQSKLAPFLSLPGAIDFGRYHSDNLERVTGLPIHIFGGVCRTANFTPIPKRIRDNVGGWPRDPARLRSESKGDWRRSTLWLLVRVAIQMSVERSSIGRTSYKRFVLYFICTLARDRDDANLSKDLLHLMPSKILRRLSKLGPSVPDWLFDLALETCVHLREVFDARWRVQSTPRSPFRNPSHEELVRDTRLPLLHSREYICKAMSTPNIVCPRAPFDPSHHRRGTLEDFLSLDGAFFDEAYRADPSVTIYDIERSIEQEIDDWVARVVDTNDACTRLDILMDQYCKARPQQHDSNPEHTSITILTIFELFIALDKVGVKEIPMLADCSPGIPIEWLEQLCLRGTTSLHRLSCVYQYLVARESRSRFGWSVVTVSSRWSSPVHETENNFPVRYYNQSPRLQQLKARIEQETMGVVSAEASRQAESGDSGVAGTYGNHQVQPAEQTTQDAEVFRSPLPALPLHAKTTVFELQCPPCFRIWRSAIVRICGFVHAKSSLYNEEKGEYLLLKDFPKLRPYIVEDKGRHPLHLVYFYPAANKYLHASGDTPKVTLRHCHRDKYFDFWYPCQQPDDFHIKFELQLKSSRLDGYVNSISHTSNGILAEQVGCPVDCSLDEFITFGHLRSGASLQWYNILQGLRNRTLNLRREEVYSLLAHAAFQAGPLDPIAATWAWHQALQDTSFCDALIDEVDSLFMDCAGLIDWVFTSNISLLLTRILASSPGMHISARASAVLRRVRRKTFTWVQELSYDLQMAPTNEERETSLLCTSLACRSTFDVDRATHCPLIHSAEDVDALLSCSFFVHAYFPLRSSLGKPEYWELILDRDGHLAHTLEEVLNDAILTDPSNHGGDLAIANIFASYRPSALRVESLQYPNIRWLTCQTNATQGQSSQTVGINLLDGQLRVDGLPFGQLPRNLWQEDFKGIMYFRRCFVMPSDLTGMNFMTLAVTPKYRIHFSLRDSNPVVRAQCNLTNEVLELVPSSLLVDDLPPALVDRHLHWLNISSGVIEIRSVEQPWEQSAENWRIERASESYHAYRGRESLVDIRSQTWAVLSKRFECLAAERTRDIFYEPKPQRFPITNILITTSLMSTVQPKLSVMLPHHALSFFVNDTEELESSEFKHMVYDEDQSIQALFGLQNILVLRSRTRTEVSSIPEGLIPRVVLIPDSTPKKDSSSYWRFSHCTYHVFRVDTELGCLVGNGNPKSMRFLAYLHTTSSFHQPDPLTGKTGTQAALDILRSAGCQSIMQPKALIDPGDCPWSTTENPHFNIMHNAIRDRYYWDSGPRSDSDEIYSLKDAEGRAAHRFPLSSEQPTSQKARDDVGFGFFSSSESRTRVLHAQYTSNQHTPSFTLSQLLSTRQPPRLPQRSTLALDGRKPSNAPGILANTPTLDRLFSSLQTNSPFQQEYLALLARSASISKLSFQTRREVTKDNIYILQGHYTKCRNNYMDALRKLKETLGPTTDIERAFEQFGQWPPATADSLLRCLASTSRIHLSDRWKECLLSLARLLLELQRSRRLFRFAIDRLEEEFWKEMENEQCDGWNAEEYPDWLLIQVQGDFLIRRAQAETAMELMSPQSGGNTVMQVNMGEGKSSVIIPIAAAALADGKQLVRVIVPKALTAQMFDILVARLGWLTNRPIYHLPFSRTAYNDRCNKLSISVSTLYGLMSQCMAERGILLVQPEHIVSLKLMTVEKQIHKQDVMDSKLRHWDRGLQSHFESDNKDGWLSLQRWVYSHARDILDESDEILHPRFQMIYTVGLEQHMDGYPHRWTIIQQILRLVKNHVHALSRNHPNSVEYEQGPLGSFPRFRISAPDVGRRLISILVEDVMAGRLANFNFQQISCAALRDAVRSFISDKDVLQVSETVKMVKEYAKRSDKSYLWNGLVLLRGLLSSNILLFALSERRWRIDYGPSMQRLERDFLWDRDTKIEPSAMLAVPYRAKDVPAPNTQFGHPDLTIILTCLSYYYAGLTKEELRASFEILLDQDDPYTEYQIWIRDYESLPESLQKLSDINPRSSEEWDNITFPLFAHNQRAIDFYLSQVVFPRGAKEYPWKLCGSSWDLGENRERLITGFSGTSDGRWLLPMSVVQHELDDQRGTSASVLARLLQQGQGKDSGDYIVTHQHGQQQTTSEFLELVATQRPEIHVLLDVGATILDQFSTWVAIEWLRIARDAEAAVYVDKDDELMVLPRNGEIQRLLSSPFSQRLDKCIVYLDHPHTRGIDLKFPIGSRAAVTLGPKVTKDALVQGCMRMRKLGHGHSVMFFAPPGVDLNIRAVTGKQDLAVPVTINDVLSWSIRETWADIEHRAPYWAQQGIDQQLRYDALSNFCNKYQESWQLLDLQTKSNNELELKQLSDVWVQPNCKSLADLYAPRETEDVKCDLSVVPGMQQRCKDLGVLSIPRGGLEEEQEQEVQRQQEREREVELPPKAEPADHFLHPDVVSFVKTGIIHSGDVFLPIFTTLGQSTAATHDADVWSSSILATADFTKTIEPGSTKGTMDQYRRPVQWILSGRTDRGPVLIILSPFEADHLLPDIRISKHVHLHLYVPRSTERMKPSDDLRLYVIPPLPSDWTPPWELVDQLNVFSGQLYLRDYEAYLRLCRFLGVPTNANDTRQVRRNLFNMPRTSEQVALADSRLPTVMALLGIRGRGRPFDHTHMGRILQGQILTRKDFKGPGSAVGDRSLLPPPMDVEGENVESAPGPSTLPKRGLETEENSKVEGPSQKRARMKAATIMHPSPLNDAQDQPGPSRVSKRALETADASLGPPEKRPRVD